MSLSKESLIIKRPDTSSDNAEGVSIEKLLSQIVSKKPLNEIIDTTYFLLQRETSFKNMLRVWEIRLVLHLFKGDLSTAKKEGINLNNELYSMENNVKGLANSTGSDTAGGAPLQPIYPLPKNNDETINYGLLIILLRLKSIPNLNLVNEFYKLTYQLRLKSNPDNIGELEIKLQNLSYDIVVILSITKNCLTLVNFLHLINSAHKTMDSYTSNINLVYVLTKLTLFSKKGGKIPELEYTSLLLILNERINQQTLQALKYVLSKYEPNIGSGGSLLLGLEISAIDTIDGLYGLIVQNKITTRSICCIIGLWNLQNRFNIKLVDGELVNVEEEVDSDSGAFDQAFYHLSTRWKDNINRVYCLE